MSENGMAKVYAVMETIDPDKAREYLSLNDNNRPVSKTYARALAGAILRGEWALNGETVKFDSGGKLIDGQHRLHAIVTSDQAVQALVVRNAGSDAQDTVDTGTRRSLSHALKIRNESNAPILAAAVGWLYRLHENQVRGTSMQQTTYPTIKQGISILENNPGLREGVAVGSRINARLRIPGGLMAALFYEFSLRGQHDAEIFAERLLSGAELEANDPIYILRESALRYADERPKPTQPMYAAIIVKGWNAYREGRTVSRLWWSPGGARRERFPAIR